MKIIKLTQCRPAHIAVVLFVLSTAHVAMAQESAERSLEEDRALLEQEARSDMDAHFTYAAKAVKERNAREAEWALREMLEKNPGLNRVKLELALVLVPQGKVAEAKTLLEEVKASNPPPDVAANIDKLLVQVNALMAPHVISGGFTAGINYDTNANSAPSSGDITVLDTSIPLGNGAMSNGDVQLFGAANVNHVYRYDLDPNAETLRWKTDFLAFGTEQNKLDSLNLQLYSLRTGPEITLLDSGVRAGLFASYATIRLDGYDYLDNPKLEATVDIPLSIALLYTVSGTAEYRDYHNAPSVSTYEDRNGYAFQMTHGLRYAFNDQWLFNSSAFVRSEEAEQAYFTNDQFGVAAGATYLPTPDIFINAQTGYRFYDYDSPDPLISINTRQDHEYTASLTVGHNLEIPGYENRVTLTAGYQYRDVQSNIQNYEYDNHRITTSVSVAF